jgi:hypothetical protein
MKLQLKGEGEEARSVFFHDFDIRFFWILICFLLDVVPGLDLDLGLYQDLKCK